MGGLTVENRIRKWKYSPSNYHLQPLWTVCNKALQCTWTEMLFWQNVSS